MAESFIIRGGNRLKGKIEISGSKNSALPIVAACLLAEGKTTLHSVPRLSDLDSMNKLMGELGCHTYRHDGPEGIGGGPSLNGPLDITVTDERQCEARYDIVKTMRASICVLGPLVAKRGKAVVSIPGGCAIGDRPVDLHVRGMQKMGAQFHYENGNIVGEVPGEAALARASHCRCRPEARGVPAGDPLGAALRSGGDCQGIRPSAAGFCLGTERALLQGALVRAAPADLNGMHGLAHDLV